MRRQLAFWIAPAAVLLCAAGAEGSWVFRPSYFTHEPETGHRVAKYAPGATPYVLLDGSYRQSGYRHIRSSLRGADGTADRMHVVETWGAGESIRPYGEWQRPYRAGATPYGPWGNPQGPWTAPFGAWVNPYGLGRLPYGPYYPGPYYGGRGHDGPGHRGFDGHGPGRHDRREHGRGGDGPDRHGPDGHGGPGRPGGGLFDWE
jgi:hypothetical protein